MRRFLIITLSIILVGTGVWFFFFKTNTATTTTEQKGGFFQSFFPLLNRNNPQPETTGSNTTQGAPEQGDTSVTSQLTQVISSPVAGITSFTKTREVLIPSEDPKVKPTKEIVTEHFLRFVSRSNGYVYEIKDGGIPLQITNTYIPNIYEAFFADGGNTAVLRFLRNDNQTIATYTVPIPPQNPDGTRTQKVGTVFPDNIDSIAVSTDSLSLLWKKNEGSDASIAISTTKGLNKKELYRSPFHEWLILPAGNSTYLQTKASGNAGGFLYRINPSTKQLAGVLSGIPGLTASISPKGSFILYSESTQGAYVTKLLSVKTGGVRQLPFITLPEKCAWFVNEDIICAGGDSVPLGTYPDDWYKGVVSFTDNLYRVYSNVGVVDTLYENSPTPFDATNLSINESEGVLYFLNKPDGSLWRFEY